MPRSGPTLTSADVAEHVRTEVFDTTSETDLAGLELEWLTIDPADPGRRTSCHELEPITALASALPNGSSITIEPGGQIELSTVPISGMDEACSRAAADLCHLHHHVQSADLGLVALGADPIRSPSRIVDACRYEAMETFFDAEGSAGLTMMCNTASIQLNIGLGAPAERALRWRLANQLTPVLVAMFANSPFANGTPSGWLSTRVAAVAGLDPSRSSPVPLTSDPADAYITYLTRAQVMLIRTSDRAATAITSPFTFGQWMAQGHELGWPDETDLAYHLTTLFPPVRPRGWLELRVIDALPTPYWQIAAAITDALLDDHEASALAGEAVQSLGTSWRDAARFGLAIPALGRAARTCASAALSVFERDDRTITDAAARFIDHLTDRGRCPADDLLDRWRDTGEVYDPTRPDLWSPLGAHPP